MESPRGSLVKGRADKVELCRSIQILQNAAVIAYELGRRDLAEALREWTEQLTESGAGENVVLQAWPSEVWLG